MNASEIIKSIEAEQLKAEVPQFNVGDTVKVYGKIKEGNRERIQVFEGTVLKRQGGSNRETFTVRKISNGVGAHGDDARRDQQDDQEASCQRADRKIYAGDEQKRSIFQADGSGQTFV